MKKFGLIGSDISGSGSPELFREAYGGKWPYDLLEGPDFEVLWRRFLREYQGVNITAPYKEKAFAQIAALTADGLGSLTGPAFKAGAVNLAAKIDSGEPGAEPVIHGDNTDFAAVVLSIAEACFPEIVNEFRAEFGTDFVKRTHQFFGQQFSTLYPQKPQALVAGCGGAGRAAAVAAAELGFDVILTNRTKSRAAAFAMERPEYGFAVCDMQDLKSAVRSCDVIIYTASSDARQLQELEVSDFEKIGPNHTKIVIEANYKTPSFKGTLLMNVLRAGAMYTSGREWLRYQALAGYPTMTGHSSLF